MAERMNPDVKAKRDEYATNIRAEVIAQYRSGNNGYVSAAVDGAMVYVDELLATIARVETWATSLETDIMGDPSLAGRAIAAAARAAIRGDES